MRQLRFPFDRNSNSANRIDESGSALGFRMIFDSSLEATRLGQGDIVSNSKHYLIEKFDLDSVARNSFTASAVSRGKAKCLSATSAILYFRSLWSVNIKYFWW